MPITSPLFYFFIFGLLIITVVPLLNRAAPGEWFDGSKRNLKLEGLRGLLAPSVFFHHALITYYFYQNGKWEIPPSLFYEKLGSGPVLIFFFMTGFLFWKQASNENSRWDFKTFLLKRCRRLMPAYYSAFFILVLTVFSQTNWALQVEVGDFLKQLISWISFGLPMGTFTPINGFANTGIIIAGVIWTLRYEWIFYIFFGWLRKFSSFKKAFWLLVGFGLLKDLTNMEPIRHGLKNHSELASLALACVRDFSRFMVMGFGVGILASYANTSRILSVVSTTQARIFSIILIGVYFYSDQIHSYSNQESMILGLFFLITVQNTAKKHLLHWKGFQLLGHISYGIYLFHGIALYWVFSVVNRFIAVPTLTPVAFWSLSFFAGSFSFIVAFFSYKYIEKPFLK